MVETNNKADYSQKQPLLSVVILNWNTRGLLRDCLKSVLKSWEIDFQCHSERSEKSRAKSTNVNNLPGSFAPLHSVQDDSGRLEVIVVDNASSDGSPAMVRKEFPQVRLVCNKKNLGFAKGNNLGINQAKGKYTLLLNSDTIVKPGALERMVRAAQANSKIGALGPRLLNQDGSDQWQFHREFPSLGQVFWVYTMLLGRLTLRIPLLSQQYLGNQDRAKSRETNLQLSGAALMVPTKLLQQLGGLDENFYFWLEDVDLCWRIKNLGYKLYYLADAEIIHLGGASSQMWSNFKKVYNFRLSMLKYFQKHQPSQAKWVRRIFLADALIMIPICLMIKPSRVKVYTKFLKEF